MSRPTEQLLRVQNFMLSSDGYGTGEGQSFERPFGHADPAVLASWAGATASWPNRTDPGGTRGLDDYFTRDFTNNIGAEIMGRGKFGPQHGPWEDLTWQGWWGDTPPFHTPVFVLTHHLRPSFSLSDTSFHFIDAEPAEALRQAKREGHKPERELLLYALHGLLHLCGYNDKTPREFRRMHRAEDMILTQLGVGPVFESGKGTRR